MHTVLLTNALYFPASHAIHAELPTEENVPAGHDVIHAEFAAGENVPKGHDVAPEAPTSASCVTGPVAVQVVELLMGRASYTEW